MTLSSKVVPALLSALFLTACGGVESTSSEIANNPAADGTNTTGSGVTDPNRAPEISGIPAATVEEGRNYAFTPVANDADGDNLSFSVENLPYWATFDNSTGRVSGTPDSNAAGTYSNLIIRVSDGKLSAALPGFNIVVLDVGGDIVLPETAPTMLSAVVNGTDIVVTWTHDGRTPEGGYDVYIDGIDMNEQYRTTGFTATITGLDLSVRHCFNVESRYLSSINFPQSNQVCSEAQTSANQAPTINGTPAASVLAGDAYIFTPSASDPDNDSLSFSVSQLPSWASFNEQTGEITGQPQESDVGVYEGIVISVSDGDLSASTSPFDIEVKSSQAATGSLALRWTAPVSRTDGTALAISEIDGYYVYLGETAQSMQIEADLSDGQADSFTLENLPVGTYFVALTVYDMDDNESDFSNTLEVTVGN
jgi:hypothetical protein